MLSSHYSNCNLSIVHWNANGLIHKKLELEDFIKEHQVDILLITETHLKKYHNIYIPNYTTIRNDRTSGKKGGTAIIINNKLKFTSINYNTTPNLEITAIKLHIDQDSTLNIIATYKPPNSELLKEDLEILFNQTSPTLVSTLTTRTSTALLTCLTLQSATQTNGKLTHGLFRNLARTIILSLLKSSWI